MKKILLSAVSVMACMSMSAAVPQLQDQFTGSIAVKQDAPNYSNPSTYDTDGNLIMTGAFDDTFGSLGAIGTSAYIIKYDKTNKEAWRVGLTGAATITSITTDDLDNIYVAGTLADELEFGTTSGSAIVKDGLKIDGSYTSGQYASFIAKYDKSGAVKAVETFVPSPLKIDSPLEYWPASYSLYFEINKIKVSGNRIYASAVYTGETIKDEAVFKGNYINLFDFGYDESAAGGVFSMTTDLTGCQNDVIFRCAYEESMYMQEAVATVNFDINKDGIYAGFSGGGKFNITVGGATTSVDMPENDNEGYFELGYVFVSPNAGQEPVVLRTKTKTNKFDYLGVDEMQISGSKLYAVGAYMGASEGPTYMPQPVLPAAGEGKYPSEASRVFVATIDLGSFSLAATDVNDVTAGTTDGKENNTRTVSAGVVDGVLYLNNIVEDFGGNAIVGNNSFWFDGTAFSAAPVAATGIAVGSVNGNGVVALPSSNATALDYKTFTFVQTGIENIGADFDENAPVEYFNLQGIRVANPENGIFIRRQGAKATKVVF